MCLTPITISNPTRRFVRGLSKPLLRVPCGHCKECIKQQQDNWFIRSVFESKRIESRNGDVWFPTLTFDDDHLHFWHDPKHNFTCPCFDVEDFKRFRDSFRTYLTREGYDCFGDNTIRYFYACEYGSKRGRSHIHCLLFVPFKVSPKLMHSILQKSWNRGFVMWSKLGMRANTYRASQYCMKYLSKEMSWYKQYGVDKYLKILHEDIFNAGSVGEAVAALDLLKRFRRVTPGHKQSTYFGIDGVNYFKDSDGLWNYTRLVDGRFNSAAVGCPPTKSGDAYMFNMPAYYVRKIFYDLDEWNLYRLNDLGAEVFSMRFDLSLKRLIDKYQVFLSNPCELSQHLSPLHGVEADQIFTRISDILGGRTARDLAVFNQVYRDVEITSENNSFVSDLPESTRQQLDLFSDNALDFMLSQKSIDIEPSPKKFKNRASGKIAEYTFNDLPCFEGFTEVLNMIEDLESQIGIIEQAAYERERLQIENLYGVRSGYTSEYLFQNF